MGASSHGRQAKHRAGTALVAEGFDHRVPQGYVYFAMAFSLGVEMLNLRLRKRSNRQLQLHRPRIPGSEE
jgi:hypothetical protein